MYPYVDLLQGKLDISNVLDYAPKYLAVGSNSGELTGASGTKTAVQITDISLYHEIGTRIKLNRLNSIEDNLNSLNLKLQFEAYIPETMFVGETIREMALMLDSSGFNAFARITGFEINKTKPDVVIQVIWEISVISIETSSRYVPLNKTNLITSIDKAINKLYSVTTTSSARTQLNDLIQPSTKEGTALYYLITDSNLIKQTDIDDINKQINDLLNQLGG